LPSTPSPSQLIDAIRAVADGRAPAFNQAFEEPLSEGPTPREREVLRLVAEGMTTQAVAEQLQIMARTVHFHLGNLFAKLGARSRIEMVHLARKRGWLD
jgi:DNA-binding NarL/FixJ family response regulator